MGELYDICKREFERLKPKYEEAADVDLTHVQLLEVEEYLDILAKAGKSTTAVEMEFHTTICKYASGRRYGLDIDAVVVNEFRMSYGKLDPGQVMAHELGHAAHIALDDPFLHEIEDRRVWIAFTEGFAVYFQTHRIPDLGADLQVATDKMRDALVEAYETGELNDAVKDFTNPWYKIDGYAFFRSAVERAGPDIIFDILANPPQTMEEIGDPETYLKRVMPDG